MTIRLWVVVAFFFAGVLIASVDFKYALPLAALCGAVCAVLTGKIE